jgi:hypothetical protein
MRSRRMDSVARPEPTPTEDVAAFRTCLKLRFVLEKADDFDVSDFAGLGEVVLELTSGVPAAGRFAVYAVYAELR